MTSQSETPGRATKLNEVPSVDRWNPGYSPADVLSDASVDVEDIRDIAIVIRYGRSTRQDDVYNVLSSSMSMHELLGLLDLGKMMSISSRRMGPDEEPTG